MSASDGQSGLSGGQLGLLVSLLSFLGVAVLLAAGLLYWRARRLKSDSLTYTTFTGPFGDRKVTISTKVSYRTSINPQRLKCRLDVRYKCQWVYSVAFVGQSDRSLTKTKSKNYGLTRRFKNIYL